MFLLSRPLKQALNINAAKWLCRFKGYSDSFSHGVEGGSQLDAAKL